MTILVRAGLLLLAIAWFGCGGRVPEGLGADQGSLAPCPNKPNCVSSFADDGDHRIAALVIEGSVAAAWAGLQALLEDAPRAEIIASSENYIHVVYVSSLMRYRDDVEFLLRTDEREIAIRSASRVGYGDMGVNRSRIEAIRDALSGRGLMRSSAADGSSGPAE